MQDPIDNKKGFTLIEVIIGLIIIGIIFAGTATYFYREVWQTQRVNQQEEYLHRELQYALDFMINGIRDPENEVRIGGIIRSTRFEIPEGDGNHISLFISRPNEGDLRIGEIMQVGTTSIIYRDEHNQEYIILPRDELDNLYNRYANQYRVDLRFQEDPNGDDALVRINIVLSDEISGRKIIARMNSNVRLRKYEYEYIVKPL